MKLYFFAIALFLLPCCTIAQKPVGLVGFLLNYPNARDFTLSADGKEAYLTLQSLNEDVAVIVRTRRVGKIWSNPVLASFSGTYRDIEPFLSSDGLRLYFSSDRPLRDTSTTAKDYDIWYVERKDLKSDWGKPVNLGAPINTSFNEFYPSLARNGNIYFTSDWESSTGKDDIFFSAWNNGYTSPVPLPAAINSEGFEFNAFIAPDESYILYTGYNRKEGFGSGDLYISHKSADGTWSPSKNLGPDINSKWMDYCPFVDAIGSTLYFTSRRSAVQSRHFATIKAFKQEVTQYENGLSRIYRVPFRKN